MENPSAIPLDEIPAGTRLTVENHCLTVDGRPLMLVCAGNPVETVMEQAMLLVDCMQRLILSREPRGKDIQTTTMQFVNELIRGMLAACYDGLYASDDDDSSS